MEPNSKVKVRWRITTLMAALCVRALLMMHNLLAIWRVVVSMQDNRYWALAAGNIFSLIETLLIILKNGGSEWKWWCPCFLSYLLTTFPAIWLLQINQYHQIVSSGPQNSGNAPGTDPQALVMSTIATSNETNETTVAGPTTVETTTEFIIFNSLDEIIHIGDTTWIVMIQESLVYLIVFGRWILPRANVSRAALSDLLLQYLGMASDIMELYALFDEDVVSRDLGITYTILALWSLSFMQFVPVLMYKNKNRTTERERRIEKACGDHFPEVFVTCSSMFLQDGPFLCLRLYVIVHFELVTYSLVFFALKNTVTVMLLFYRLAVLCVRLPCCYKDEGELEMVQEVDLSTPVFMLNPHHPPLSRDKCMQLGAL